jgi:hypothetical protein
MGLARLQFIARAGRINRPVKPNRVDRNRRNIALQLGAKIEKITAG